MKRSLRIIAFLLLANSISYAVQDANPVDVNAVLTALKTIKKQQTDTSKANKVKLAHQFMELAGNPAAAVKAYEEAIFATKFVGLSHESTQFQEWKKAEADHMKSAPFRDGISLHLQYLSLTLRRSAGAEMKDLVPVLISFTQQVMGAQDYAPTHSATPYNFNNRSKKPPSAQALLNPKQPPPTLDNEWVGKPISGSIFVISQQIGSYLSGVDSWEMVPGNVDGIYEKSILPEFRRVKDQRLLEYWDMRMQREELNASKSGRDFDLDKYNSVTKPNLLWSRAQELLVLNMKNRAVNDMVGIIKAYPMNPNVPDWVSQVEQLLAPPAAQSASPAASVAPSPSQP